MTRPVPVEVTDSGDVPAWIEPQLATLTKDRFSGPAWIFERKLDGERCTFPEAGNALAAQLMPPGYGLDGEIVASGRHQSSFTRLQRRLGVENPGQGLIDAVPAFYYFFDVMHAEGRDTRALPQLQCKELLRQLLPFRDPLRRLREAMPWLACGQPSFERGNLARTRVHWVEPHLAGQVAFTGWTRNGQLRHPRFQGLRPDEDPAEVRRETV